MGAPRRVARAAREEGPADPRRTRGTRADALARAKIGELMMRLELAEDVIEKRGFTDEWKRRAAFRLRSSAEYRATLDLAPLSV